MPDTLPDDLADAPPRHRHLFRVLAAADGWVSTQELTDQTGYAYQTVRVDVNELVDCDLVEQRRCPLNLHAKEYRA